NIAQPHGSKRSSEVVGVKLRVRLYGALLDVLRLEPVLRIRAEGQVAIALDHGCQMKLCHLGFTRCLRFLPGPLKTGVPLTVLVLEAPAHVSRSSRYQSSIRVSP